MTSYSYKNDILGAETGAGWKSLGDVVGSHTHPVYIYNSASLQKRAEAMKAALSGIAARPFYAVKANANDKILKIIRENTFGADVVSMGETKWALENGFKGSDIIFSGVGKSKEELTFAVQSGLAQINCESLPELSRLGEISKSLGKTAAVGLRINPDIKVDTHPYITTGFRENKFGISEDQLSEALNIIKKYSSSLALKGLSCHLGSQIRDLSPIFDSLDSLLRLSRQLGDQGFKLSTLDIGGGVGIDYHTDNESEEYKMMEALGAQLKKKQAEFNGQILLEPGRWLVGRCGVLCAQVEYVKFNGHKNFLILNTGMNHLMRPSLYKAFHRSLLLKKSKSPEKLYDLVGPICESSDVLGHDRMLPTPNEGDWIALMDAGAYGMSMANAYNHHEFPAEVLI